MEYQYRILGKDEFGIWDEFVSCHADGTVFHSTNWLKLVDADIRIHTIWLGDHLKAGVALLQSVKNKVKGYHIPSYTQYFAPLYGDGNLEKLSLTEAHLCIGLLLKNLPKGNHFDFKLPRGHQSILPYHWQGFETSVSITHIISTNLNEYLKQLNKNKLRELKKLQQLVEVGELRIEYQIGHNDLQHLLKQTEVRKGYDANANVATAIVMGADETMARNVLIRSKKYGPVAFGFFPYDKHAVYNLINASVRINDPVYKTINLLLIYDAIEFALTSNRIFDFEGSMLPGVETFCRLMGGVQSPVYRVQKSPALMYSLLRAAKQIKNDRKKA